VFAEVNPETPAELQKNGHIVTVADVEVRLLGKMQDGRRLTVSGVCPKVPGRNLCTAKIFLWLSLILFFSLALVFCVPGAWADQVNLSTPQAEYFFPVGNEAAIPVTIASTYDHDITGTLSLSMAPEYAGTAATQNESTRERAFSAFTDSRTVSLPIGESDVPADYLLSVSFMYNENGERSATLPGITIHFVTKPEAPPAGETSLFSTDSATVSSGSSSSSGQSPATNPGSSDTLAALVNNQVPQDTRALQAEIQDELNRSGQEQEELMGYIAADPVVSSLNQSLVSAGFTPGQAEVFPASNRSGSFSLSYVSGKKSAVISGLVNDSRVRFAQEFSHDPVPLPDPLRGNASYQDYQNQATMAGFTRNQTTINATPDNENVDIALAGPGNRILHATATIRNGTVTAFAGDSPDDPLAIAGPAIALAVVILLCAGIWYFARFHEIDHAGQEDPAPPELPRDVAWRLLEKAESEAAQNRYPEAYRTTSRALRIYLAGTRGNGKELTSHELWQIIPADAEDTVKIRWVLERGEAVGFAKDIPDPGEFREMVHSSRRVIKKESREDKTPETNTGNTR
jgi:hypothetical protein